MSQEEVFTHYCKFWGEPVDRRVESLDAGEARTPISVYKFAPSDSDSEDWVYATSGASCQPTAISAPAQQAWLFELFILSREENDDLFDNLMSLALYPTVCNTYFDAGHTIHGMPGKGIVSGSPLTDIVLLPAFFQAKEFRVLHRHDGAHIQMLWVVPITQAEREFAVKNGWRQLVGLFFDNSTDTSDLWRRPVC